MNGEELADLTGLNLGLGLGRAWRTLTTGSESEEAVAADAPLWVEDALLPNWSRDANVEPFARVCTSSGACSNGSMTVLTKPDQIQFLKVAAFYGYYPAKTEVKQRSCKSSAEG